jgi:very-short-patch-repair endonuclease
MKRDIAVTEVELKRLYLEEFKTPKQIGEIYGCNEMTIVSRLKKYGVKIRGRSESLKLTYEKGRKVWNTGLTKDTNESVANISKGRKVFLKNNPEAMNSLLEHQVRFTRENTWDKLSDTEKEEELKKIKIGRGKPEAIKKQSQSITENYIEHPEIKEILRNNMLERFKDEDYKTETIAKLNAGRDASVESEEGRAKRSESTLKYWADPEWKDRQVGLVFDALKAKPNKPETKIQMILDMVDPNKWQYTGDGKIKIEGKRTVGGKLPDFWNGDHKLIEHFGTVWHDPEKFPKRLTDKQLVEHFAKFGYKCLIIWETEWSEPEKVVDKIKEFVKDTHGA